MLYYNPLDRRCKSAVGAIEEGESITFQIFNRTGGDEKFSVGSCYIVFFGDEKEEEWLEMDKTEEGYAITLRFHSPQLLFYYFATENRKYQRGAFRLLEPTQDDVVYSSYQLTVYAKGFTTPEWMKGGVMYQIFPDRFCKVGENPIASGKILRDDWGGTPSYKPNEKGKVLNNDFFGGNLRGVISKLDYLKSLGVTILYFNPIFEAYSNHRYDTGDYMKIDRLFGTEKEFDELIAKAKDLGIRIILDGVFNHTGDNSRYFNKYGTYDSLGAFQSIHSPYIDWYNFQNFPNRYDSWWGIDILPAINETSKSYQNFICGENGVLRRWMKKGIGGFRLDVADELPDFFLEMIRSAVKAENPEGIVLGEVWEDASNKIAYSVRRKYFQGFELDSVMNYPLKDAIINYVLSQNTTMLRETIFMLIDHYPTCVLNCLMNILGTHDTPRILTVMGEKQCSSKEEMEYTHLTEEEKILAKRRVKVAALLEYTLPGVPCIYYGDENSMEGYLDPFCRRCFDWENTDHETLAFYRKLGQIRSTMSDIFSAGEYGEVFADETCLVFRRYLGDKNIYVYVNLGYRDYRITLGGNCDNEDGASDNGSYRDLINEKEYSGFFDVRPQSFGILVKS